MATHNSRRIEKILLAASENLEKNQVFGRRKRKSHAEELVNPCPTGGCLLEGQRRRNEVDLKSTPAKPNRSCLPEPCPLDVFPDLKSRPGSSGDEGFRFDR